MTPPRAVTAAVTASIARRTPRIRPIAPPSLVALALGACENGSHPAQGVYIEQELALRLQPGLMERAALFRAPHLVVLKSDRLDADELARFSLGGSRRWRLRGLPTSHASNATVANSRRPCSSPLPPTHQRQRGA